MLNSTFSAIRRQSWTVILLPLTALGVGASAVRADVITDWDAKISAVASPAALGEREAAQGAKNDRVRSRRRPCSTRIGQTAW